MDHRVQSIYYGRMTAQQTRKILPCTTYSRRDLMYSKKMASQFLARDITALRWLTKTEAVFHILIS